MALKSFSPLKQVEIGADVYVFKLGSNCNGTVLAAATSEHAVCVLDPQELRPIRQLDGHTDVVEDLDFFQAEANCLVSCSHDGTAMVWDLRASEACSRRFNLSSDEVYSCSVGRGDAALACAASEKVHLLDIAGGKSLKVYKDLHTDVVNHIRFHPVDNSKMLTGAEDNLVVVVDTNEPNEDDCMLAVIPNEECVRRFTLVGPARDTLCCASTTEDVRIWGLGPDDLGAKRAEFLGLRQHPLLAREDSFGYVVETFYDQPSEQVFLLAGAGNEGDLVLFRVTLDEVAPMAVFTSGPAGAGSGAMAGHTGIVRSGVCMPGGVLVTAGEDGRVCAWHEDCSTADGEQQNSEQFALEPSAYGASSPSASRAAGGRVAPY